MKKRSNSTNISTDIRGATGLTIDAVIGITDMVESLHNSIAGGADAPTASGPARTRGVPGLVYRNIRRVTKLVGGSIDVLLAQLSLHLGEAESPPAREAILAALNGVIGDHLCSRNNPLAIPMQIRREGQSLNKEAIAAAVQQSNGRVIIMLHGLCMNDMQWRRKGHDHGEALARDLGIAPLYVHYNSGLHVSENGRKLSDLLQSIVDQSLQPLELFILGYSMGGLIARSACYYGETYGYSWLEQLRKLVFLGTPHHGAHLEKGGNLIDVIMGANRYSAPFSRLGKIRSSGFTDLRYGNVLEDDWHGRDRFDCAGDQRIPLPLPEDVACYAIAATTTKYSDKLGDDLVGDGLVTVSSALGRHKSIERDLMFPESRQWIGRDMNHIDLLNDPRVYDTITTWLA